MTEGEWMGDRWSMMLSLKKKKKKKKKKMFPFLLFIYFLSRSFIVRRRRRGEKRKERKEKREAKVILSTWNKSTWFLLPFFCFVFTTHIYIYPYKKKATRKLILYAKKEFPFYFLSFILEFYYIHKLLDITVGWTQTECHNILKTIVDADRMWSLVVLTFFQFISQTLQLETIQATLASTIELPCSVERNIDPTNLAKVSAGRDKCLYVQIQVYYC